MEIRRSYDRLISTTGFPILVRHLFYIELGPGHTAMDYLLWQIPESVDEANQVRMRNPAYGKHILNLVLKYVYSFIFQVSVNAKIKSEMSI